MLYRPNRFVRFANYTAHQAGNPGTFLAALLVVLVWGATGPLFHFSDTWQLVINTGTTVVTFLMVFLIQNTQNRDARATHLKLDELIHAIRSAHNELISVEKLTDNELEELAKRYEHVRTEQELRKTKTLNVA